MLGREKTPPTALRGCQPHVARRARLDSVAWANRHVLLQSLPMAILWFHTLLQSTKYVPPATAQQRFALTSGDFSSVLLRSIWQAAHNSREISREIIWDCIRQRCGSFLFYFLHVFRRFSLVFCAGVLCEPFRRQFEHKYSSALGGANAVKTVGDALLGDSSLLLVFVYISLYLLQHVFLAST